MTMIQIYDNFFSEELREEIFEKLMEPGWVIRKPYWGSCTDGTREVSWSNNGLEKQEYFSEFLYDLICKKLNRKFKGISRIYANGQTAGQCSSLHVDDGDLTFLYYPSPEWDIEWQGHLIFLNEKEEGEKIILYKPNRAVLFNGDQPHYADAPARFFNGLRICLAYKLWN